MVFSTRTHPKAMVLPVIVLVIVLAAAGYLTSLASGWVIWVIWVVAALIVLVFVLWPFLVWLADTYTVTDRRLITRTGVLTRRGHDIPLNRVSDVSTERGVLDRVLGCGTLVIADASTDGEVRLPDVPHVQRLQLQLSDQLFRGARGVDDGT